MKKMLILLAVFTATAASAGDYDTRSDTSRGFGRYKNGLPDPTRKYYEKVYGNNKGSDQYGRESSLHPAYRGDNITPNSTIQRENAYGPGMHMDQYGNPVVVDN